jgi:hypothetical protein
VPERAPLPLLWLVTSVAVIANTFPPTIAGTHPTLLITPNDVPRIRHLCGVGEPGDAAFGRFGAASANWLALRKHFRERVGDTLLPGELASAAFMHIVDPGEAGDAKRIASIEAALAQADLMHTDPFERALALDWCWADLKSEARREYLTSLHAATAALAPGDSPLDARLFSQKLTVLAVCAAVDSLDEPGPAWREARDRVLEAANAYFQTTFPKFVEWRGLIPTSPAVGASEESLSALAVELSSLVRGENAWAAQRDGVGRWMEHYWLVAGSRQRAAFAGAAVDGDAAADGKFDCGANGRSRGARDRH